MKDTMSKLNLAYLFKDKESNNPTTLSDYDTMIILPGYSMGANTGSNSFRGR